MCLTNLDENKEANSKTSVSRCKHKYSCSENMIASAYRIFLGTFISKFVFSFLINLRKIIKCRSFKAIK